MRNQIEAIKKAEKTISDVISVCQQVGAKNAEKSLTEVVGILQSLAQNEPEASDPLDTQGDIFDALLDAKKLNELTNMYVEAFFTSKDSEKRECIAASVLMDYSGRLVKTLERADSKFK